MRHDPAGRILRCFSTDENACRHDGQTRVAVEEIGRLSQRSGVPPGVVIAQRDIRRRCRGHPQVASGRSKVFAGRQHAHIGIPLTNGRHRIVAGAIVHDDDRGPFRKLAELPYRAQHFRAPIVSNHNYRDARIRGMTVHASASSQGLSIFHCNGAKRSQMVCQVRGYGCGHRLSPGAPRLLVSACGGTTVASAQKSPGESSSESAVTTFVPPGYMAKAINTR